MIHCCVLNPKHMKNTDVCVVCVPYSGHTVGQFQNVIILVKVVWKRLRITFNLKFDLFSPITKTYTDGNTMNASDINMEADVSLWL